MYISECFFLRLTCALYQCLHNADSDKTLFTQSPDKQCILLTKQSTLFLCFFCFINGSKHVIDKYKIDVGTAADVLCGLIKFRGF